MRGAAINALAVVLLAWASACSASFSDNDIEQARAAIRAKYQGQLGFDGLVTEVNLVQESPRKLTGYVKMKLYPENTEVSLDCTATMGLYDRKYIFECKPRL